MVEITIERLQRELETERSSIWFERRRPYLVQLGVLRKCGRAFFGDLAEVVAAIPRADELYFADLRARRTTLREGGDS